MAELSPAEYSMAWAARRIIEELQHPALSAADSLATIRQIHVSKLQHAQDMLAFARAQAENHELAESDQDGALMWCGFCGAAEPDGGLEDDGLALTGERIADVSWFCAELAACIARRRARHPDRKTPELQAAREHLALAAHAARPAAIALVALTVAEDAQRAALALSASLRAAQPRPRPSREQQQRARFAYTISNPAHRQHLISGRRRPR